MRGVKMKEKTAKEKKIQRYMLKTYLVMAFISVFVGLLLCIFMVIRAGRSIGQSSQGELEKAKLAMDNIFGHMEDVLDQICKDNQVVSIADFSPEPYYYGETLMEVLDLLHSFESNMELYEEIDNIYFVDAALTTMIGSQDIYHDGECTALLEDMGLDGEFFTTQVTPDKAALYVIHSGTSQARLFMIQGVYKSSYTVPDAYILLEGDMAYIVSMLNLFTSEDGGICYLVSEETGYIGTDSEGARMVEAEGPGWESGGFTFNRVPYTCSVADSVFGGLKYVYVIPALSYYEEALIVVGFTVISTVALLVSSVILAWRFTRKNMEPLERMSAVLSESGDHGAPTSYDQMLRDLSALNTKVKDYEKDQDKNELSQILLGQEKDRKKLMAYEAQYKDQIGDGFYIFGIRLENINELSDANVLTFCVRNVFGEILAEHVLLYPVEGWDRVYFLLQGEEKLLREKIDRAISYVDGQLSIEVACGVSSFTSSFQKIVEEKFHADYMIEYVELTPELRRQMWYSESGGDAHLNPQDFRSDLNRLIHQILIQDYVGSRKLLEKIWTEHIYVPDMKPDRSKSRMQSVRYIVQIPFRERFGNSEYANPERTLYEMYKTADTMLARMEEQEEPDTDGRSTFEQLREYIISNATDPSITAGSVCDAFHLTASYASGMYKKYAGEGILDAIHKERIRQAKSLLKNGMSVQDTARKVGYLDARGFIRTFKKYEGITPGQYKNI